MRPSRNLVRINLGFASNESCSVMETSGYRLLLPEGTLDYFIISDVKESKYGNSDLLGGEERSSR